MEIRNTYSGFHNRSTSSGAEKTEPNWGDTRNVAIFDVVDKPCSPVDWFIYSCVATGGFSRKLLPRDEKARQAASIPSSPLMAVEHYVSVFNWETHPETPSMSHSMHIHDADNHPNRSAWNFPVIIGRL